MKSWAAVLLLAACAAPMLEEPDDPEVAGWRAENRERLRWPSEAAGAIGLPDYARWVQGAVSAERAYLAVETSVRRLRHPAGDRPDVILAGMAHVGSAAYFRSIEVQLHPAGRILYESDGRNTRFRALPPWVQTLVRHRVLEARLLDAVVQAVWDDSVRDDRWVPADAPFAEADAAVSGTKWESDRIAAWMKEVEDLEAALAPGASDQLKRAMRRRVVRGWAASVSGGGESLPAPLASRRDRHLWTRLQPHLEARGRGAPVAVVFGATHMVPLEQRLREVGYRRYAVSWHEAMRVTFPRPAGATPASTPGDG